MRLKSASTIFLAWAVPLSAEVAVEARSPHFEVRTTLPRVVAFQAAGHLERVRTQFRDLGLPPTPVSGRPIRVIIFRSKDEFASYRLPLQELPGRARGLYVASERRRYITLAWEAPGDPLEALAHEYAHRIFGAYDLPLWLSEGLAEYFSTVRSDGRHLIVGTPPQGYLARLRAELESRPESLAAPGSPTRWSPVLYPLSWLGTHLLISDVKNWQDLDWHAFLAQAKAAPPAARALRAYLSGGPAPRQFSAGAAPAADVSERILEEWEWPLTLADLLVDLDQRLKGETRLLAIRSRFPKRPEPCEALGAMYLRDGDYPRAEEILTQAVRLGSQNARTKYGLSLLLMRQGPAEKPERVRQAVEYARQASREEPGNGDYLLAEAQAFMLARSWESSIAALQRLLAVPGWARRAEVEFRELIQRRQMAASRAAAPGISPAPVNYSWIGARYSLPNGLPEAPSHPPPAAEKATWPPAGTVLVYGHIVDVECRDADKLVTVRAPRRRFRVRERAHSPAALHSAPPGMRELPCGPGRWEVNVYYRPSSQVKEARGELVAVVF